MGWRSIVSLVNAGVPYEREVLGAISGMDDRLDPIYEAKCAQFLQAGDLLWVVGVRPTMPQEAAA